MDYINSNYFELDKPLLRSQLFYLNKFLRMRHVARDIKILPEDPILKIIALPFGNEGEFYIGSNFCDDIPIWTPQTNYLFNDEFKQIVLLLMCIQRYYLPNIDKNLFYIIIQYLSLDPYSRNFNLDKNLLYLAVPDKHLTLRSDTNIISMNDPPETQPDIYCHWIITNNGNGIKWNENEPPYNHITWLRYIIDNFIVPWDYILKGSVDFTNQYYDYNEIIILDDNIITIN